MVPAAEEPAAASGADDEAKQNTPTELASPSDDDNILKSPLEPQATEEKQFFVSLCM